ncbi:MAG: hypothetical protein RL324_1491 [Verrucomicrobiota bacterium]|jgi:hypothetical protein
MLSAPTEVRAALPRRIWIVLAAVFALGLLHFWIRTTPVRLATTDDVAFQEIADADSSAGWSTQNAISQARFYYATPMFGYALTRLYEIREPWLFSLLRAGALFFQIGLAGWLWARVVRSPAWGATLAFFILGALQIPRTFYPILSYPIDWIGFCAGLIALHFHQSHLDRPTFWTGVLTGVFFLLACLMHEIFVLLLPAFLLLSRVHPASGGTHRRRANLAPLVTATSYTALYLLFSRNFPTTYDGTMFSSDLVLSSKVLVRQLIGILPGFELVVQRLAPYESGPFFRGGADIARTLRDLPWPDLVLGLLEAGTLTGLLLHCARSAPSLIRWWPWALGFGVLFNLPIAFSAKHQVFILHREFPYAYAFYAAFFLASGFLAVLVWILQQLPRRGRDPVTVALLGLASAVLCLSTLASNHQVLQVLRHKFN